MISPASLSGDFAALSSLSQVDWDVWFFSPGMPPISNVYDSTLAEEAYDLAKRWHTCDVMGIGSGWTAIRSHTSIGLHCK